jgi:crotonobetainyl-CoA:carnitine CoA-transferase CaiB-like acyl-CoA transferase
VPTDGLLTGVKVLDVSIWRPGPYTTRLLADLGAAVLKVEPPGGDPMRAYRDLFDDLVAGKRTMELDLKSPEGQRRIRELATEHDVLVEGYRPGVAERLGVGYEAMRAANPAIVYCSISGFGQTGPLTHAPGHDINYQALAGVLAPEAHHVPTDPATPYADLAGGLFAAFAICAALVNVRRTGEGEQIDVSMTDALATWAGASGGTAEGAEGRQQGLPHYGIFECADGGRITLGVIAEDHFWRGLCQALDLPAGLEDLVMLDRIARYDELRPLVEEAIAREPADVMLKKLSAHDVPVAPVLDRAGMLAHEHFRARGTVVDDAAGNPHVGHPVRYTHRPATPPA